MEAVIQLVVGAVAEQILAVQLLADALNGLFQAVAPVIAELAATGSGR